MKFSEKNKLSYNLQGKGTVIVLIHGFLEDAGMWDDIIAKGFEGYSTLTVDLPGFGASPIHKDYSIEDFAEKILVLLSELNIDQYFLFGHSMGGYIALAMMEKKAAGVLGFGLIHSHPFADSLEGKEKRQRAIDFINKFGSTLYIKQVLPLLFPKSFATSNRFLLERLVFRASKYPAKGISNALAAMKNRPDRQHVLKELAIPFLAIIGKKDELLPTEDLLKQASLAPITQAELIVNAGHMGPFEQPVVLNKIIKAFIQNFSQKS